MVTDLAMPTSVFTVSSFMTEGEAVKALLDLILTAPRNAVEACRRCRPSSSTQT
jgi:hypothetical protein